MCTASRAALAFSLALLLLPAANCSVKALKIQFAGFAQGNIDGIWLWRRQSTGSYSRVCKITISDPYRSNGTEVVSYDQTCPGGGANGTPMMAQVQRLASDPNTVTMVLMFQTNGTIGTYKATAYNAAGESGLSSGTVKL